MSADAQTPPAEAAPPSGIKRHLPFIAALVLGLGAGGASGAFFVGPAMAKGIAPAGATAVAAEHDAGAAAKETDEEEGGEKDEGKKGEKTEQTVYMLDNLVLNPAESGGARFLLLSIAFEAKNATVVEELKARDAELRDAVLVTLGAKTVEQLSDMRLRDSTKAELIAATGKLFKKKGSIVRVYFPQFVIQ